jgi:MFS family permease
MMSALPLVAIAGGVLLGGWMTDVVTRRWGLRTGRRVPGLVGFPLAAGAILLAVSTPNAIAAALLLALASGAAAFAVIPAFAVCVDIGSAHAGIVSGTMNMFAHLGGALSPIVIGTLLDRSKGWEVPLSTVAAAYIVAAVCCLAVDPTRVIRSSA